MDDIYIGENITVRYDRKEGITSLVCDDMTFSMVPATVRRLQHALKAAMALYRIGQMSTSGCSNYITWGPSKPAFPEPKHKGETLSERCDAARAAGAPNLCESCGDENPTHKSADGYWLCDECDSTYRMD